MRATAHSERLYTPNNVNYATCDAIFDIKH
jgi:hypothetical protein